MNNNILNKYIHFIRNGITVSEWNITLGYKIAYKKEIIHPYLKQKNI